MKRVEGSDKPEYRAHQGLIEDVEKVTILAMFARASN